jgi:hypothetical protein
MQQPGFGFPVFGAEAPWVGVGEGAGGGGLVAEGIVFIVRGDFAGFIDEVGDVAGKGVGPVM